MRFLQNTVAAVSALALICAVPSISQAQTTPAAEPQNDAALKEVIVTAERKKSSVQKTAAAISAITGDALAKSVTSPMDISKLVPAINIGRGGGGQTQTTIRGIGTLSGNAYSEQAIATNIDGVYVARANASMGMLFDLERVEVLKGPQGTLYGRNATAGALNLITAKPDLRSAFGSALVDVGNFDAKRVQGFYNLPLSDSLAIRLAGQKVKHDGYLSDGYDDANSGSGRASLLYKPNADLSLTLTADYNQIKEKGGNGIIYGAYDPSNPYNGPSTASANGIYYGAMGAGAPVRPIGSDGYYRAVERGVYGELNWNLGRGTLTAIAGERNLTDSYLHYMAGYHVSATELSDSSSLEVRYATPDTDRFSYIVGAFGFRDKQAFDLLASPSPGAAPASHSVINPLKNDSWALFGQGQYRVTDATRLSLGLRYSRDHKTVDGMKNGALPVIGDQTFEKTTWKVTLEHDLAARNMLYVNIGTGFKAGGFFNSLTPNTYRPENLTAYAVGSKNRFFSNKVQFNAEAYYWKYKDKQVTHLGPVQPGGFDLITENAGSATLYGVDMDAVWRITGNDRLSGNLQYEHSRYDNFVYSQETITGPAWTSCKIIVVSPILDNIDCSGNSLTKAPEWSGNISYDHTFDLASGKVNFAISEKYESEYWVGDEHLTGQLQKGYNKTDLEVSYTPNSGVWTLSAYGNNLENKAVKTSSFVQPVLGQPVIAIAAPRTYGVRLSVDF